METSQKICTLFPLGYGIVKRPPIHGFVFFCYDEIIFNLNGRKPTNSLYNDGARKASSE